MTWKNRTDMEETTIAAFVVGSIVLVIWALFLMYKAMPDRTQTQRTEYKETQRERAYVQKRIRYHGLTGVVVLKEVKGEWRFYRDGTWCRL